MNKITITTLLLCTGIITAGCEKTYSVAEFKKDEKLRLEWDARCGFAGTSKNCENMRLAFLELEKEYKAQAEERSRKAAEKWRKSMDELMAKEKARHEKWEAEFEAKQRAKAEREAKEKAEQQQDTH
ncbi:EexN family lipoprotein [Bartonella krasnovii]|uniref:EexN family lipoprotein n=1 Tax=Bartonella krasnovii TaxID=2267275 RepID=UPI001F4CADE3|nr:EexN family lipoprotein [Bartonella krasnovii]UNF41966.1 EexN family lipoprotein [Bartonella krasnovii]UNF55171.1 EexN family lipoprotein [Bartonella krasnovii]